MPLRRSLASLLSRLITPGKNLDIVASFVFLHWYPVLVQSKTNVFVIQMYNLLKEKEKKTVRDTGKMQNSGNFSPFFNLMSE